MGAKPPGLNARQLARPRGLGPEMASIPCPLRILTPLPGIRLVRPGIAAGKTIFGGVAEPPCLIRDSREPITARSAATCRASGPHRHGGGVRSGVCLREWLPVLARGCRQLAATWIRLGSEGRDLTLPCRSPCRRPRRNVPVLALRGDDEPRITDLEGGPDPWASMESCRGRQRILSSPQG
jgi:hypothetical protein